MKSILLLVLAAALCLTGCKREPASQSAPSAPRPTRLAGPTTAERTAEIRLERLAKLYNLPPLGEGLVYTAPDGETWSRFTSGLMIHDLQLGPENADFPRTGQSVTITYKGTFPGTETVFDQCGKDNPFTFTMASRDLIKGFSMGVTGMRVGGRRRVFVPPDLAYGPGGNPTGGIGLNQALIFEIELLKVYGEPLEWTAADVPPAPLSGPPATEPATATSRSATVPG